MKARKADVKYGQWKTGPMTKSLFQLTKSGSNALRFRGSFEWCLVTFTALGSDFKLLVVTNLAKEQYYAHLGMVVGSDTRMLASLEFHGSHPGWHIHAGCAVDVQLIPVGRYKGEWRKTLPRSHHLCRRKKYGITQENRLLIAIKQFGLDNTESPDGQQSLM